MHPGRRMIAAFTIVSALLLFAAAPAAFAAATWLNQYTFPGEVYTVRDGEQTSDGGYITVAYLWNGSGTNGGIALTKFDTQGNLEWSKTIGDIPWLWGKQIEQMDDGGYVIAGWASVEEYTYYQGFLIRLDAQGALVWQKRFSGARDFVFQSLKKTADGGFVVFGQATVSNYNFDFVVMKFNANGETEWQRQYDFMQADTAIDIIRTPDGGYLAAGITQNLSQDAGTLLMKLDAQGAAVWQKTYNYAVSGNYGFTDAVRSIQATSDGGYIIAGFSDPDRNGGYWWVMKTTDTGDIQWQKSLALQQGQDLPLLVGQARDGGFLLTGVYGSMSNMAKLSSSGDLIWARTTGRDDTVRFFEHADGGLTFIQNVTSNQLTLATTDADLKISGSYPCTDWDTDVSTSSADISFSVTDHQKASFAPAYSVDDLTAAVFDQEVTQANICAYTSHDPSIEITPAALDLGSVKVGNSSTGSLTIANKGTADLSVDSFSLGGDDAASFAMGTGCPTLAPNTSCTVTVTFTPASLGLKTATLAIASNDPADPVKDVSLSGTGNDAEPPSTSMTISGVTGSNNWYLSDVTFQLTATDLESGVKDIHYSIDGSETVTPGSAAAFTLTSEGSHTVAYYAADNAGNIEDTHSVGVNIDKTIPVINGTAAPASNGYGWNNSDVTISFTCTDEVSGIGSCTSPVSAAAEGAGQVVTGTATDRAGNTASSSVTLNIDKTGPEISIIGALDGEEYLLCTAPSPSFLVSDALSGVLASNGILINEGGKATGLFTYTVTASDKAGNHATTSANYHVGYDFRGFVPPVTLGRPFKKGSVIPVKFSLGDGCGRPVSRAIASLKLQLLSGDLPPGEPIDATSLVPDSGNLFRYSPGDDLYIYNLATRDLVVGTYAAVVSLDDGSTRSVPIRISKH